MAVSPRRRSSSVRREWFSTTLEFCDEIARALDLAREGQLMDPFYGPPAELADLLGTTADAIAPHIGTNWHHVLITHALATIGDGGPLSAAVREAEQQRRATFRYCRYCRRLKPPEFLFSEEVCQGCSSRFLTVVY